MISIPVFYEKNVRWITSVPEFQNTNVQHKTIETTTYVSLLRLRCLTLVLVLPKVTKGAMGIVMSLPFGIGHSVANSGAGFLAFLSTVSSTITLG